MLPFQGSIDEKNAGIAWLWPSKGQKNPKVLKIHPKKAVAKALEISFQKARIISIFSREGWVRFDRKWIQIIKQVWKDRHYRKAYLELGWREEP